jgi:small subunit ribosomal protein S13
MARIAGVDLQDNWRLDYALTHIKGIGWSHSREIIKDLKLEDRPHVSDLSSDEVAKIATKLEDYLIEGDLARKVREDIQRLKVIGSYRGIRHTRGLPVRGQRTRSNARTKRGKRRTVGAFKKEALVRQGPAKKEKEE